MSEKDTITVYWSTTASNENESWSQLYPKPSNLVNFYRSVKNEGSKTRNFFACPAFSDMTSNTFIFKAPIDDEITVPDYFENRDFEGAQHLDHFNPGSFFALENNASKISASVFRNSSIENHVNIVYNLSWIFFAEEPLVARFTAPYFPAHSPCPGAMLACGEFDIGQWFRAFNLDYHVPVGSKKMVFKEDDPLYYLELKTDKKVILKRFNMTNKLMNIGYECSQSPMRYSRFKPLSYRYRKANESLIPQIVLDEIKKNVVD